jgi:hypothetical protein
MTVSTEPPPPGSDDAHAQGCLCPGMDNAYGRGCMGGARDAEGRTLYVMREDCPLHGWTTP